MADACTCAQAQQLTCHDQSVPLAQSTLALAVLPRPLNHQGSSLTCALLGCRLVSTSVRMSGGYSVIMTSGLLQQWTLWM